MLTIEEAIIYCQDNGIPIKGQVAFDGYLGFVDLSNEHLNGYCILCDLNMANELCNGCAIDESCKL